jgi:Protein of unknown function (DUF2469)
MMMRSPLRTRCACPTPGVWDMYRPAQFLKNARVITFKDVNVEELDKPDLRLPESGPFGG